MRALAQVGNDSAGAVVMPSSDQVPEPDWRPPSQEELLECIVAGLDRLRSIAAARDPEVQADLLAAAKGRRKNKCRFWCARVLLCSCALQDRGQIE